MNWDKGDNQLRGVVEDWWSRGSHVAANSKMADSITSTLFAVLFFLAFAVCQQGPTPYIEKYFDQIIDHFNFGTYGSQTYKQRYLIQGTLTSFYFIFFALSLTSNEWKIESGRIQDVDICKSILLFYRY